MSTKDEPKPQFDDGEVIWLRGKVASSYFDDNLMAFLYEINLAQTAEDSEFDECVSDLHEGYIYPEDDLPDRPLIPGEFVVLRGQRKMGELRAVWKGIGWVDWDFTNPASKDLSGASITQLVRYVPSDDERAQIRDERAANNHNQVAR